MELPFRLLVAAISAAITIPAVTAGLEGFESRDIAGSTMNAIGRIFRIAQQFYLSGGGAERVAVEFPSGFTVRLDFVSFGGDLGDPLQTTARYKLAGEPEVLLLSDPAVPLGTGEGALLLGSGRYLIGVTYEGAGWVRLEVVR